MTLSHSPINAGEHRPDIEGLRAIAVIAVLLFHLDIAGFDGGFVGVDAFFVISGFLIGGIVVREVQGGTFSFADYLTRRVRRIMPVMLVVLTVVTIAAMILLMPSELVGYSWSLGFSALFMANIHFWLHRGAYAESEHEVLLHMWTLGVEGQFYLLLPLLVLSLMRFGRSGLWFGLVVLAVLSAAVSLLYPSASFYNLPARLWEFLIGMMVAITPLPFLKARWVREGLALIGTALILFAVTSFNSETPFPGWRAAIPCVGAAAIIAAGSSGPSFMGKVLSLNPVRFIGKISYSLYLWHWPVIVLLILGLPVIELSWQLKILAAALSVGLATLSWRYVEEPFRGRGFAKGPVMIGSCILTVALAALALVLTFASGWPQRFSDRGQAIAATMDYPLNEVFQSGTCFIHNRSQSFNAEVCMAGEGARPRVLIIGDSHAAHLAPGLAEAFPGSAISQVTAAGCRPVINQPVNNYPFCADLVGGVMRDELSQGSHDLIVLAGRWEVSDLPALERTLEQLNSAGRNVLLVGPAAEWSQFIPRLLTLAHERGIGSELPDAMLIHERGELDADMAKLAAAKATPYFSIYSLQCDPGCGYFDMDDRPLVIDNSHFTYEASALYAGEIAHPALVRAAE